MRRGPAAARVVPRASTGVDLFRMWLVVGIFSPSFWNRFLELPVSEPFVSRFGYSRGNLGETPPASIPDRVLFQILGGFSSESLEIAASHHYEPSNPKSTR